MPFIAECTYCQGKMRVPDHAAGASMECPRCHNSFTVVPTLVKQAAAAPANVPSRPYLQGAKKRPKRQPVPPKPDPTTETDTTLATLPSTPAAPPTPPPPRMPEPEPEATSEEPGPESEPEEDAGAPAGTWEQPGRRLAFLPVVALLLAGIGLCCASLPHVGVLTLPLAALAVVLGLAGLVTARESQLAGVAAPLAAVIAGALVLVVPLLLPALFSPWPLPARPTPKATGAVVQPFAGAQSPVGDNDWVDVTRGAVQFDDARLRVTAVLVDNVEQTKGGQKQLSRDKYLIVRVRLSNVGAARILRYESWSLYNPAEPDAPAVRLTDAAGKTYARKTFAAGVEVVGQVRKGSAFPGQSVEDVLIFETPPASAGDLRLELPTAAFGRPGVARLAIPQAQIRRPVRPNL